MPGARSGLGAMRHLTPEVKFQEASKKTGQPSLLIGHYVEKTGLIDKTGDRFIQRSDQSEGLVDRFSCLVT